ncbi:MAG: class I SAM-dependent methyltransferase [Longimicrobiales bacterium]
MASMKVQSILRLTEQLAFDSQVETGTAQDIAEVLEIGAGTGAILEELSTRRPKWNLTALDVAEASIAAIRRLGLHNLREGMIADASRLPFSDKQFDLAILSHVIEHLPDPTTALREAKRVAHLVIIEVPVEGTPVLDAVWWIRKLRGRQRIPNELGHLWHRSVREWNRMIAGAGLTILANFQYLLTREALVFGKSGRSLRLARLRATGQVIFRTRVWGNLVYSHYAVLVT